MEPVEPDSLYSFTKVEIQALSLARSGAEADYEVLTSRDRPPVELIAKTFAGLRQDRIESMCAAFVLSDYTKSDNQDAATLARYLVFAYQMLGTMTDEMLGMVLQGSLQDKDRDAFQASFSDWKAKRRKILAGMEDALNISLSLLVDESRTGGEGKPDHLILTRVQKAELLSYLHSQFPSLSEANAKPSGDFTRQAAMIQSFLTGSYKPADER